MVDSSGKTDWHALEQGDVFRILQTSEHGLGASEAKKRKEEFGPNELQEKKTSGPIEIFLNQFKNVMVYLLVVCCILLVFLGEIKDAAVIGAIVLLNALLGFQQEYKAEKAVKALKAMAAPRCVVVRSGEMHEIPSQDVVPGDVIALKVGDRVPADARLIVSTNLTVDESTLTGESMPVSKATHVLDSETVLSERRNMVFSGTIVSYGHARAVVTATAMNTEFGKIAELVQTSETVETPLQKKLGVLTKQLATVVFSICFLVFLFGVLKNNPWVDMFLIAVSLGVAAVPEGLPAVVTIALTVGVQIMAKKNAIIRKLSSVESLGCATVICSDKTGTLTKNEMVVREVFVGNKIIEVSGSGYAPVGKFISESKEMAPDKDPDIQLLSTAAVLCNDAKIKRTEKGWHVLGDPTEAALIVLAEKAGVLHGELGDKHPRMSEFSFESERKRMSTIHKIGGKHVAYIKGAPEEILKISNKTYKNGFVEPMSVEYNKKILKMNEDMAGRALRVLAIAYKELTEGPEFKIDSVENDVTFVGLVGMIDYPREEAKEAIKLCRSAGIQVVMITGDHRRTAIAVAKELGLVSDEKNVLTGIELEKISDNELERVVSDVTVYARAAPEHKLRIVKALQKNGHVVAVTGDGVNDAPALKNADIGVAMGITGTDVTKEASTMILADDNFATIVTAIEEGRVIYDNIKSFVKFLLSANAAEVAIIGVTTLLNMPLPLLPLHLLWLNIVTDGPPALALAFDPADPDTMKRPPRGLKDPTFPKSTIGFIAASTVFSFIASMAVVLLFVGDRPVEQMRTVVLTVLVVFELLLVFNCRSDNHPWWELGMTSNMSLLFAVALSFLLHLAVVYLPAFNSWFKTAPIALSDWLLILLLCAPAAVLSPKFFLRLDKNHHKASKPI